MVGNSLCFDLTEDPPGDPAGNMAADERLAEKVCKGTVPSTLRLYGWDRPAISLGRRQSEEDLPQTLFREGLPLVWRPTGGGTVVHQPEEFTYALAVSRADLSPQLPLKQLPERLHECFQCELVNRDWIPAGDLRLAPDSGAGSGLLCFESPVQGDLLYRGRKVAGSALRVWREAFLIQGSIQGLPVANERLQSVLLEAVSAALGLRCPHPPLKSGI